MPDQTVQSSLNYLADAHGPQDIRWTAKNELEIRVISSAEAAPYLGSEIGHVRSALTTIAGGHEQISLREEDKDGARLVVASGEGAQTVARALRDEKALNFTGSANIPGARAKG